MFSKDKVIVEKAAAVDRKDICISGRVFSLDSPREGLFSLKGEGCAFLLDPGTQPGSESLPH